MDGTGLFIFRRDLRVDDNTALNAALEQCENVVPCFFFDPRQLEAHEYRSVSGMQFLFESLKDLELQLENKCASLFYCLGNVEERLPEILKKFEITKVFFNADYSQFSKSRDQAIKDLCEVSGVTVTTHNDLLLKSPGEVLKADGKPYTIYTPFSKNALRQTFRKPINYTRDNFYPAKKLVSETSVAAMYEKYLPQVNENVFVRGGRTNGLAILKKIPTLKDYMVARDFPAVQGTTKLSAHNKFGTISPREIFDVVEKSLGRDHTLIRELLWRDFFTQIGFYYPHVYRGAFYRRYDSLEWDKPGKQFEAWKAGMTGFPIVDGGMRELKQTGYMHNRVRMIVASFLTKDLHISWREGEKHFAHLLVDYDPAVNNGNWQWAASTGCDAQPYFRIFNPWLQQERFDAECQYIKKWVPELSALTPKKIHSLYKSTEKIPNYPSPIVEHSVEKTITEKRYSAAAALGKKAAE